MFNIFARLVFVVLTLVSLSVVGDTVRYAVTQTEFAVRAGRSFQERALTTIKSGEAVNVLETDSIAAWSRVKTQTGVDGWIQNKYLTESLPSDPSSSGLTALKAKHEMMAKELAKLRDACFNLAPTATLVPVPTTVPTPSALPPAPSPTPPECVPEASEVEQNIQAILAEYTADSDQLRRKWFLSGAVVTLLIVVVVRLLSR